MIKDSMELIPTAFSSKKRLKFDKTMTGARLKKELNYFLSFLIKDLKQNGCKLIGHVKGLVDVHDKGHLMFSITDFDEKVRFKGGLGPLQKVKEIEFTINIIVYGIELSPVKSVFKKAYDKFFG